MNKQTNKIELSKFFPKSVHPVKIFVFKSITPVFGFFPREKPRQKSITDQSIG